MSNSLFFKIALTLIPGVGPVLAKTLISYCGSAEAVFKEKELRLRKIPDIGPVTAKAIAHHKVFELAEKECDFISKNKIKVLYYLDQDYPWRLKNCGDSPILIYFKGNADLNASMIAGIVGTRTATIYGKEITAQLVEGLGQAGVVIVSGLAYGIDICAHKVSVKNNIPTIGVVGHGLDRIYPSDHRTTAARMVLNGGILTEFPSGTNPDKENFPARNRIVAGMCDAIIVVESAVKGGALITADIANGYNRDVFAVPGNVHNIYSRGCNQFIKENKAALIESAEDVLNMMQWNPDKRHNRAPAQQELFHDLNEEEKCIASLLENGQMDIDTILQKVQLPVSRVSMLLLNLELKGVLKALPGKQYRLVSEMAAK